MKIIIFAITKPYCTICLTMWLLCGYSLGMNMVPKINSYENYHFHYHKTVICLTVWVLIRNASSFIEHKETTRRPPSTRYVPGLETLNNPYVIK